MYFTAVYAADVEWIHHAGAIKYEYSDANECGSPRRAAWPVLAIARESCVHSSSSVKSQGVRRSDASTQ
jgi:hypothetical protein